MLGSRSDVFLIGGNRILRLLGRGGMGEVYLAWSGLRLVAVKVLLPELADDPVYADMFLSEARAAGQLHHTGISQVFGVGRDGGRLYMVMEYVAGRQLAELIEDPALPAGPLLPWRAGAAMFLEIAGALAAAHRAGIAHRDISPRNLLVTDTGAVKLIDFGIARGGSSAATTPGTLKGQFGYMAPEYLLGRPSDHRVDLFALGIVMWETFARRRLFPGAAATQVLAVVQEPAPRLEAVVPDAPAALAAIIARLLERDPARRYQSADEVARALEAAIAALPVERAESVRTLSQWVERHLAGAIEARARLDRAALAELDPELEPVIEVEIAEEPVAAEVVPAPAVASARGQGGARRGAWPRRIGISALVVGCVAAASLVFGGARGSAVPAAPIAAPIAASSAAPIAAPIAAPPVVVVPVESAPAAAEPAPVAAAAPPRAARRLSPPRRIAAALPPPPPKIAPVAPPPAVLARIEAAPALEVPPPAVLPPAAPPPPPPAPPPAAPPPRTPPPTPRIPSGTAGEPARGGVIVGRCNACHARSGARAIAGGQLTRAQWDRFFRQGTHDRYLPLGDQLSFDDLAAAKAFLGSRSADASEDQGAGVR